ncbi:hypothetical protein MTO96_009125 [Rhipicephalus appendiculatus]
MVKPAVESLFFFFSPSLPLPIFLTSSKPLDAREHGPNDRVRTESRDRASVQSQQREADERPAAAGVAKAQLSPLRRERVRAGIAVLWRVQE